MRRGPRRAAAAFAAAVLAAPAPGRAMREMTTDMVQPASPAQPGGTPQPARRADRLSFADLPGWNADDALAAFAVFRESCSAIIASAPGLRPGLAPSPGLVAICRDAAGLNAAGADEARAFFEQRFTPWRIAGADGAGAFYTGYYEPEVAASLTATPEFSAPLRARPASLVTWPPGEAPQGAPEGMAAALRGEDGALAAAPARGPIDAGALGDMAAPVAFVADPVEAFMIHVQGSARLRLPDGRVTRAVYDGRNGRPYTSIGRLLVTERGLAPEDVTLDKLKAWIRAAGQAPGQDGLALLHRNESFIFFRLDHDAPADAGPIGAQGLRLTPLRSIAVDRTLWPYGTPVWIDAALPWEGAGPTLLRRLTIAQDTGSAILGPARADLFHGSGERAGFLAGETRHRGAFIALVPQGETP